MASKYETREQWLEAAVVRLSRLFKNINVELPPVRVSVGWPSKGGTASRGKVVGQCWNSKASKDGVCQIFISPTLGEDVTVSVSAGDKNLGSVIVENGPVKVLGTLVHELIHAWNDCKDGHKGEFARVAKLVGLVGKMTESTVGETLRGQLTEILADLGDFPHSPLDPFEMDKQRKKQTTRMIKLVAPDCCDYTVRTTQKWIDEGLPKCPHDVEMEVAD